MMSLRLDRRVKILLVLIAFNCGVSFATDQLSGKDYLKALKCTNVIHDEYKCSLKGNIIVVKFFSWGVAFTVPGNIKESWSFLRNNFNLSRFETKYSIDVLKAGSEAVNFYQKNKNESKKISSCYLRGVSGCKRSLEVLIDQKSVVYRLIFTESKY